MADKPFRVLLDLTELHIELLKYVWINVSPQELTTILDFKRTVIRKINLDKVDIKLFVRNGLLLDDETVMILREDDTVKVQYGDEDKSIYSHTENPLKESKKSSRKRNCNESFIDLSSAIKSKRDSKTLTQEEEALQFDEMCNRKKKKHKQSPLCSGNMFDQSNTFEGENCNTNCHSKDKKKKTLQNDKDYNLLNKSDSFFSFDNQDSTEEKDNEKCKAIKNVDSNSCLKVNSDKDSLTTNNSVIPENSLKKSFDVNTKTINLSEGLGSNCPKKKRKRHKKRKQSLESFDMIHNTEMSKEFKSFTNEAEKSIQRRHIKYSSSTTQKEDIELDCSSKNENIQDVIIDTFALGEGVSSMDVKSNNHPKISTPTQADFCKNPKWCSSLMQQTDLNSHQNEAIGFKEGTYKNCSYTKCTDEQNISYDNSENNEKISGLDYANLPPLNSRPDIGTHIAYKILELDEHYSPVISDYREGIVKSINLDNEEMEIELLKHEIKPARTGKFENLKIDEVPLPEIKKFDIVRWSNLVEPKLVTDVKNC